MHGREPGMVLLSSPSLAQVEGFQSHVSTNASAVVAVNAAGESRGKRSSVDDSDSFYVKLSDLLESSGLSLIFNVRETLLDLYLLYLEVTRRGGYHQVSREKKWGEVASALRLGGNIVKLSAQVEKLYLHLLYQFEQLYFYRGLAKQAAVSSSTKGSHKRKQNSGASYFSRKMTEGAGFVEEQVLLLGPSNDKERKKRRGAPLGQRNAYQIFLKQECARLRSCGQATDGTGILRMAIDAWKKMSAIEKEPYVEESKKNKEKFKEAMNAENKQHSMQNEREGKAPSLCSGDYRVTSQPEADNYPVNKAAVGLALTMTEKVPKDSLFLIDLDRYCSLDLPTVEPK